MMTDSNSSNKLSRLRMRLLAAGLGAVLGLATVLIGIAWLGPGRAPEMTRASLEKAMNRWKERRPSDYLIEITVQGRQPGQYRTEVRNGDVVQTTRNGHSLNTRRTITTWTVEGMFRTLDYDLLSQESRSDQDPQLTVRTEFDADYGYPKRYHRIQWGSLHELTWEVTRFEVFPPLAGLRSQPR